MAERPSHAHAGVRISPASGSLREEGSTLSADLRVELLPGREQRAAQLGVNAKVYFCQDEDVCLFEELIFAVPVGEVGSAGGGGTVDLTYSLSPRAQAIGLPF
jgi:hypothetical protein